MYICIDYICVCKNQICKVSIPKQVLATAFKLLVRVTLKLRGLSMRVCVFVPGNSILKSYQVIYLLIATGF